MSLEGRIVVSAAPYRCTNAAKGGGVQIDLLVQTQGTAYIVEVKRARGDLGMEVASQIEQKAERLPVRSGVAIRTALVYDGRLTRPLASCDAIDFLIPAERLLGLEE